MAASTKLGEDAAALAGLGEQAAAASTRLGEDAAATSARFDEEAVAIPVRLGEVEDPGTARFGEFDAIEVAFLCLASAAAAPEAFREGETEALLGAAYFG